MSQEKIYTIPVNDAFKSDQPCPLCALYENLEASLLDYYLGPALMESDVRQTTNQHGFCMKHWQALYNSQKNRLGLALVIHTHLEQLKADLGKELEGLEPEGKGFFGRIFGAGMENQESPETKVVRDVRERAEDCVICERLDQTMARYLDVIFYQYVRQREFREQFHSGKLFCLEHLALLIESARNHLKGTELTNFLEALIPEQLAAWDKLSGDVEWFTKKFDYRYSKEPWKDSKDSVQRAIAFLAQNPELEGRGLGTTAPIEKRLAEQRTQDSEDAQSEVER